MDKKSLINLCLDMADPDATNDLIAFEEQMKSLSNKIDSYIFLDKFCDSQVEMLKKEAEHLHTQMKRYEAIKERLRAAAAYSLDVIGQPKIKSDTGHTMSLRTSKSVQITDPSLIPDWAKETTITTTISKTKIKDAINDGESVPGAELVEKTFVVFK